MCDIEVAITMVELITLPSSPEFQTWGCSVRACPALFLAGGFWAKKNKLYLYLDTAFQVSAKLKMSKLKPKSKIHPR